MNKHFSVVLGVIVGLGLAAIAVEILDITSGKAKKTQLQATDPRPASNAKSEPVSKSGNTSRKETTEAGTKCHTAMIQLQDRLPVETKYKTVLHTAKRPGTVAGYIQKFRLTDNLGQRFLVECLIDNPLLSDSHPKLETYPWQ